MSIEIHDVIGALVVLAVLVLMTWIIVYSAARMAVQDVVAGPVVLIAAARDHGERVALTVTNTGSRPAYDVKLLLGAGERSAATGREVATVSVIAPGLPVQLEVARNALLVDSSDPLPRMLRASWRKSALAGAAAVFDDIPVVLVEPPAATDGA